MWSYNSVPAILTAATVHVSASVARVWRYRNLFITIITIITVSPYNNVYHFCSNSWSISIANHDVAACHFTAEIIHMFHAVEAYFWQQLFNNSDNLAGDK